MIFQHTFHMVMGGIKTQTRRPIKPGDEFRAVERAVIRKGRVLWREGGTYAVQPGRGERAVGRIRILSIQPGTISAMTDDDVRAEGFLYRHEFLTTWHAMHPREIDQCWVLKFVLVKASDNDHSANTGGHHAD